MEPQALLDHYLEAVQELFQKSGDTSAIAQLIDAFQNKYANHPPYQQLLEAEKDFWQQDYETALKKYLKATQIPNFQFFCFRASAFISEKMGHSEQARQYAEKALGFFPQDLLTLSIFQKQSIAPQDKKSEELHHILKNHVPSSNLFHEEKPPETFSAAEELSNDSFIERRLGEFKKRREAAIKDYREHLELRIAPNDNFLAVLNGWEKIEPGPYALSANCLKEERTGLFVRWQNRGILINPGRHFLDTFHQEGYTVEDIDYIIVTRFCQECYHDVICIHQLNEQLNEISSNRHAIHYYLHPEVFRQLSPSLQPQYKQERFQLHNLEIFLDSPEKETIPLDEEISLHYFSSCSSTKESHKQPSALGIVLELPNQTLGYISGSPWSPMLPLHFQDCSILCLGIGQVTLDDCERKKYMRDCLGYNGTLSLLEQVQPKMLLCMEFCGQAGDLRLEFVGQIRQEKKQLNAFPADCGFYYDLKHHSIRSTVDKQLLNLSQVKVTRAHGPYTKLQYIPECNVL